MLGYDRIVPGLTPWDSHVMRLHLATYEFAAEAILPGYKVLDAGCGVGYGTSVLAVRAEKVLGVDISQEAVGYARSHFARRNIRYVVMDLTEGFKGDFDLVTCFQVIEHLEDGEGLLRRLKDVGKDVMVATPLPRGWGGEAHVHEYQCGEFAALMHSVWEDVTIYTQQGRAIVKGRELAEIVIGRGRRNGC